MQLVWGWAPCTGNWDGGKSQWSKDHMALWKKLTFPFLIHSFCAHEWSESTIENYQSFYSRLILLKQPINIIYLAGKVEIIVVLLSWNFNVVLPWSLECCHYVGHPWYIWTGLHHPDNCRFPGTKQVPNLQLLRDHPGTNELADHLSVQQRKHLIDHVCDDFKGATMRKGCSHDLSIM